MGVQTQDPFDLYSSEEDTYREVAAHKTAATRQAQRLDLKLNPPTKQLSHEPGLGEGKHARQSRSASEELPVLQEKDSHNYRNNTLSNYSCDKCPEKEGRI